MTDSFEKARLDILCPVDSFVQMTYNESERRSFHEHAGSVPNYSGSESGWLVAEFGRQPWTIQDMLPTWASVSEIQSSSVAITFFIFLFLFTTMLAVEISILLKQIKKGPEV